MSLILTRTQNLRAKSPDFYKNETRRSDYGALNAFGTQDAEGGLLSQELKEKAFSSIGSVLEIPVINYESGVTISNTRSVTIPDSENTSVMHTFTFVTYSWGFTIVPAMFLNNEIAIEEDFKQKFNKYLFKVLSELDTASVTALEAAKTQVYTNSLGYTVTANVVQSPLAKRLEILGDSSVMMWANDFFPLGRNLDLIGNAGVKKLIKDLTKESTYQAVNQMPEYDDKRLNFTTRIADGVGEAGNFYLVNPSSLGLLTRVEREALLRTNTGYNATSWDIDTLPIANIPVGTYYYESVGDYNAIAGAATADLTRAKKEHYGWSMDVCFTSSYNSDRTTIASPIIKGALLQA